MTCHTTGHPVNDAPLFDWRALLPIHPAAELFPLLPEDELRELAEDIRINGLRVPAVTWSPKEGDEPQLLDGRNRLDALGMLGLLYKTDDHHLGLKNWTGTKWAELSGGRIEFRHIVGADPYALALSFNIHRRHLTAEQKRDLIAKLLTAKPEASNLSIAEQVKADDKTVAKVRHELEANSEIPNKPDRVEPTGRKARGRKPKGQPATKTTETTKSATEKPKPAVSPDDIALREFDGHICRLLQMTHKAKPARFAKTGVHADELAQLGEFLLKVASEMRAAGKRSPTQSLDPLKVNWHHLNADDLETAIRDAQQYGVDHHGKETHEHKESRLRLLERMKERRTELRVTERTVEAATRH